MQKKLASTTLLPAWILMACVVVPSMAQEAGIETNRAAEFDDAAATGGIVDELDSMDAQVEAAEKDGGTPTGTTPRSLERIEEIVVSARKREEALEDTPISVTALGAGTLREAGVERLDQIQNLVPNLQIQTGINGYDATVIIRGVGQGDAEITFDPGVGIYVDGVYLARAQGSVLSLIDTQQIEVLRGPQGTLFGKNTVGGAINLTTVKPAEQRAAYAFIRAPAVTARPTPASPSIFRSTSGGSKTNFSRALPSRRRTFRGTSTTRGTTSI